MGESEAWKQVSSSSIPLRYFCMLFPPITKQSHKIFVQTFRCTVALWKSWVCKYSIIFQVIKFKLLCETLKNEKFLLDIHTKCGDNANEILNAAIDAEKSFKCKCPYSEFWSDIWSWLGISGISFFIWFF